MNKVFMRGLCKYREQRFPGAVGTVVIRLVLRPETVVQSVGDAGLAEILREGKDKFCSAGCRANSFFPSLSFSD